MSLALVTDAVPGNVTYGVSHDVTRHHWLHKVFRPMDLITSMPYWLRPRRNLRYALRLRLIVNTRSALQRCRPLRLSAWDGAPEFILDGHYGVCPAPSGPTKLDKIKNLYPELQVGTVLACPYGTARDRMAPGTS